MKLWTQFWLNNRPKPNFTASSSHYRSDSFISCLVEHFISNTSGCNFYDKYIYIIIYIYIYLYITMCFSFLMFPTLFTLISKTEEIENLFLNKTIYSKNFLKKYFPLLFLLSNISFFQTHPYYQN